MKEFSAEYLETLKKLEEQYREHEEALLANPEGGNLYEVHPLQVNSGTFWRCKHGSTGHIQGLVWAGCKLCALDNPVGFYRFHFSDITAEELSQVKNET